MDFEQVYKKYYSIVYRYLLTLTKDNNMAEEIAQETFYKALKNISKYNPEMKMLTCLYTIAKNTYFTEMKKQARYEVLEDDVVSEENIIDQILLKQESSEILQIVHQLEEPYKEVFSLRIFGGIFL